MTTTSPAGRTTVTHLDDYGRVSSVEVPGIESVGYAYDSHGRLSDVTQGTRTTHYEYGPDGYLDSVTDPLSRTVSFETDEAGRVTKQILPDTREIRFAYDANGNVTSVTPPVRPAHGFDYTPADQLHVYTPPDAGFSPRTTTYAYNPDQQLTSITRPDGQQVVYSYESNGRLDFVTLPTGTIDVGYDAQGRLGSVSAPSGAASTFGYDGPLPTSITTTGPVPGTIGFGYDSDLRPASLTVDSEAPIAYGYDADGLLTSAGGLALARNATTGFLETTTLGTTADSRTYTSYGELDTWTGTIGGSSAYSFDLDRDDAGRITTRSETLEGTTHVLTYTYDPDRGWLTEVRQDGNLVESYGYDGNGNRTSWSDFWGSGTATYDDQDRLLTAGATTYTYTPNGELLTKTQGSDVTTYVYDVRGALLGVTLPTGVQIDYLVDASGRRIAKKVDGTLVEGYLYAGGISPVAETDGAGNVTAVFVYATRGNVPDYIVEAGATYRVFTDHLGSVRMVVDVQSGAVLQQIDYDAFGRITFDSNPGAQPFGFAGGLYDPQTGLTRFGARDYDPEVGRWTSKDPIEFGGGDGNLYAYVFADPLNASDSSGLDCQEVEDARWNFGGPTRPEGPSIGVCTPTLGTRLWDLLDSISPTPHWAPIGPGSKTTRGDFLISGILGVVGGWWGAVSAEVEGVTGAAAGSALRSSSDEALHPTFRPGPYARDSIPARSSGRDFTASERAWANSIGECHTCGTTIPGTKTGNFVLDHQPVTALNAASAPQRLFPHCLQCSREQGLAAARLVQGRQP